MTILGTPTADSPGPVPSPRDGPTATRPEDFSAFVAAAGPSLLRTAWLLTGDAHRAEELVQDALVRTYVAWSRVRDGDPTAYARRIVVNARVDSWRRRRREHLVADVPEQAGSHDVEGGVARRDTLVRALAVLSARERRVVVLRYWLDLSEAQVADELGVSLGTVKSTASRALAKVRVAAPDLAAGADPHHRTRPNDPLDPRSENC